MRSATATIVAAVIVRLRDIRPASLDSATLVQVLVPVQGTATVSSRATDNVRAIGPDSLAVSAVAVVPPATAGDRGQGKVADRSGAGSPDNRQPA